MAITPKESKKGEPITAKRTNERTHGVQQAMKVGANMESRMIGKTKIVKATDQLAPPKNASQIKNAIINEVFEEYIDCNFYNERSATDTGQQVFVAKPLQFRPSFYDGETISYPNGDSISYTKDATNPEWKRQADDGTNEYDQYVIPAWRVGEVMRIAQCESSVQVDNVYLQWVELESRVWAVDTSS